MPLLLAVSSSHFFLVSSTPFIRSDDPRMFVRRGCRTIFMSIQPSHRQYCHHRSRSAFFSSSPVHFGTQYISRKPTRLIFSHTQVIRYLSFPLAPTIFIHSQTRTMRFSQGEVPLLPLFGCLPRGYFVPWPHRLCLRSRHRAASLRHEWRFADLYYILRPSSPPLSVSQGQHSPSRLLARPSFSFIQWTTSFSTLCHADFFATPFPGS